jgi:hypothetical protein
MRSAHIRHRATAVGAALLALVLAIAAVSSIVAAGDPTDDVSRAALLPWEAYLRRDPSALCHAFTARAAGGLVPTAGRLDCAHRVGDALHEAARFGNRPTGDTREIQVAYVHQEGASADVAIRFHVTAHATFSERLSRRAGRWTVSSIPVLVLVPGCTKRRPCPAGAKSTLFSVGTLLSPRPRVQSYGTPQARTG